MGLPANEDNYLFLIRDEGSKLQLDNKKILLEQNSIKLYSIRVPCIINSLRIKAFLLVSGEAEARHGKTIGFEVG